MRLYDYSVILKSLARQPFRSNIVISHDCLQENHTQMKRDGTLRYAMIFGFLICEERQNQWSYGVKYNAYQLYSS